MSDLERFFAMPSEKVMDETEDRLAQGKCRRCIPAEPTDDDVVFSALRKNHATLRSDLAKAREEIKRWEDKEVNRAVNCCGQEERALLAERARDEAVAEVARLRAQKDGAYSERDTVVASLAWACKLLGWRVGLGRHVGENWDEDWRNIVFIDLPTGQVSWHVHDSEMPMFDGLPPYCAPWDGHSTPEKYERLRRALGRTDGEGTP